MTQFHSKYFAHALTLKRTSGDIRSLTRSIANARIDLNPHQVHAALCALRSPLSMGVIFADEVGLGKTIEAGLVIAQKWAECKRNILLIVPAFLRKQWEQELSDKFFLESMILDSKIFRMRQKEGMLNPFNDNSKIIICSYQFAVTYDNYLKDVNWDLVVIDEAHRLRNVYKKSNKQAKVISEALENCPKLLLTATPLQNNLMELYGLVSVVDPLLFGDVESFKMQYVQCNDEEYRNKSLKARLEPIIVRTLRKQVIGYVSFTERIALTQDFYPTDDEQKLYEGVSAYLQKDRLYALPKGRRTLLTLILRKLLASSPQAILATLKKLLSNLEKIAPPKVILDDEELEFLENLETDHKEECYFKEKKEIEHLEEEKIDIKALEEEILELRSYIELAESIKRNTKSEALLVALDHAFKKTVELGSSKKVVVFTESRRTQKFLYEFLSDNGYKDKIVAISGSNTDKHSKEIYQNWIDKNKGSQKITGSKAIDIKAALIDYFKEEATILIATEAASEGVNLQFCSLLINYDLPWNPQRVEQRIGRCHRYGQKYDVVVVNFINKRNEADQRVYELLKDKFNLFDGVFGASDDILGTIESGVDIEKRIAEVYQTCRTSEEIKQAFEKIRLELDQQIQEKIIQTKKNIFEHLDEDVAALLKVHKGNTITSLDERGKWLFHLVKSELKEQIEVDEKSSSFSFKDSSQNAQHYFFNWKQAEENSGVFFREADPLAKQLLDSSASRVLALSYIVFDYSQYKRKISALEALIGKSGWLEVNRLSINTFEEEEFLLVLAKTDDGSVIDSEIASKFFSLPASIIKQNISSDDSFLQNQKEELIKKHLQDVENRAASFYESRVEQIEHWSEDLKLSLEKEIRELDKEIKNIRRLAKSAISIKEKLFSQKQIRLLESKRNSKRKKIFEEQDKIEQQRDELIERLEGDLKPETKITHLFTIRWEIK